MKILQLTLPAILVFLSACSDSSSYIEPIVDYKLVSLIANDYPKYSGSVAGYHPPPEDQFFERINSDELIMQILKDETLSQYLDGIYSELGISNDSSNTLFIQEINKKKEIQWTDSSKRFLRIEFRNLSRHSAGRMRELLLVAYSLDHSLHNRLNDLEGEFRDLGIRHTNLILEFSELQTKSNQSQ